MGFGLLQRIIPTAERIRQEILDRAFSGRRTITTLSSDLLMTETADVKACQAWPTRWRMITATRVTGLVMDVPCQHQAMKERGSGTGVCGSSALSRSRPWASDGLLAHEVKDASNRSPRHDRRQNPACYGPILATRPNIDEEEARAVR